MLKSVQVEHELDQRALQPSAHALQKRKARARHSSRPLEVHDAERLSDVVVGAGLEIEFGLLQLLLTQPQSRPAKLVPHGPPIESEAQLEGAGAEARLEDTDADDGRRLLWAELGAVEIDGKVWLHP